MTSILVKDWDSLQGTLGRENDYERWYLEDGLLRVTEGHLLRVSFCKYWSFLPFMISSTYSLLSRGGHCHLLGLCHTVGKFDYPQKPQRGLYY